MNKALAKFFCLYGIIWLVVAIGSNYIPYLKNNSLVEDIIIKLGILWFIFGLIIIIQSINFKDLFTSLKDFSSIVLLILCFIIFLFAALWVFNELFNEMVIFYNKVGLIGFLIISYLIYTFFKKN